MIVDARLDQVHGAGIVGAMDEFAVARNPRERINTDGSAVGPEGGRGLSAVAEEHIVGAKEAVRIAIESKSAPRNETSDLRFVSANGKEIGIEIVLIAVDRKADQVSGNEFGTDERVGFEMIFDEFNKQFSPLRVTYEHKRPRSIGIPVFPIVKESAFDIAVSHIEGIDTFIGFLKVAIGCHLSITR